MKRLHDHKHLRTAVILISVLLMGMLMTACGKNDGEQRYAYPLATASPEDTVTQIYAEKFAEEVDRLSDGSIKIQVYANSTLGGDRELLESCKDGDIPFVVQNTAPQVTFMPDLAIFDVPCAFENLDECREVLDDPEFSSLVSSVYEKGGYQLLGVADQGFRIMSTNKPVKGIGDFKGQKIRTMENPFHLAFWKSIGANPTPMSFAEVYIGLQQHTIDAQENPYEVIVSNRLYEQQDYVVETNHLPHLITLIMNDEFFKGMPEENQRILKEAAATATEYARQASDDRIADRVKTIEDSGTEILKIDEETYKAIVDASTGVRESIKEKVDSEVYNKFIECIEKYKQ
ncbi:MAG: TRAP transporter substrate-binding protein [Mogibacterium sp.]|nr:TRAP transporter substrate-binding protein [Mogibacterium sp.]MBR4090499.1 TRAP transporter substrate-binding protein [Mogibacterium sp.]